MSELKEKEEDLEPFIRSMNQAGTSNALRANTRYSEGKYRIAKELRKTAVDDFRIAEDLSKPPPEKDS